ncbi:MAG: ferric iron reductase [Deinococcota bacterium]
MANTHPLQVTLDRAMQLEDYIRFQLGPVSASDWVTSTQLVHPDSLPKWVNKIQDNLGTESKVIVASSLLQRYQWQIIVAGISCYLLDQRVPDLSPDNLRLQLDEEEGVRALALTHGTFTALATDPAANHADVHTVASQEALREVLRQQLEGHFGWVIDQLCTHLGCKPRGLWLTVADRCAATFIWLMQELEVATPVDQIEHEINGVLRVAGSPLNHPKIGVFTLTYKDRSQAFLDRASCCYWYREKDGDYCSTCPSRSQDDRNSRLLEYMSEEYTNATS